jgi:hypothetical protein
MYNNRNTYDHQKGRAPYTATAIPATIFSACAVILAVIAIASNNWYQYSSGGHGGLWRGCDGGSCTYMTNCKYNGLELDECGELNSERVFSLLYLVTAFAAFCALLYGLINLCTNHGVGHADATAVGTTQQHAGQVGAGGYGAGQYGAGHGMAPHAGWVKTAPASTLLSSLAMVFGLISLALWISFVEQQDDREFRTGFDYDWSFWVFVASLGSMLVASIFSCCIPTAFSPAAHDAAYNGHAYPTTAGYGQQQTGAYTGGHPQVVVQSDPVNTYNQTAIRA